MLIHNLVATGSAIVSGSSIITGNLTVLGSISGSAGNAISASYALVATTSSYTANSDLLDNRDSTTFANTGSNNFVGQQNINGAVAITGSLTTTGTITAQTINVQQVTSSIVYSSGSNIFGNSVSNTQSMTGSVGISGSLAVTGASTFSGAVNTGTLTVTSSGNGFNYFGSNGFISARLVDGGSGDQGTFRLYSSGNELISISADATSVTYFNAGNVGIGTTSPIAPLQIIKPLGNIAFSIGESGNNSRFSIIQESGYTGNILDSNNIDLKLSSYISGGTGGNIIFYTGNGSATERMRITSGGNVGIGTSSPQLNTNFGTFLTVQGTNTSGWLELATTATSDGFGGIISFNNTNVVGSDKRVAQITVSRAGANNSADMSFSTWNAGSGGTRLTITAAGAATFSGALTMSAYSFASSALQFTRAASNTVAPASGNGILVFASGNAQMRMDTANQICFDMNNGGNPHTVLTLKQSDNTVSINSPNNNLSLELKYQNVASGYLGASGSALYAYSVNGGYVLLNASSVWVAASDVKRKRNFETYSNGLSAILGLQPKLYNMDFQKDGDEKQVGLVAQEVKDFIPKAYEDNNNFIGLNYNAIIVTMINAIKELSAKITQLENK